MTNFVQALVSLCEEDGNSSVVEGLRNAALSKMAGGDTKSLISSSVNGKSFSFHVSKAADVLFAEASQALRIYHNGSNTSTEFDFSYL